MAAFESNTMLRAQFPTATVREALKHSIEKKAYADILDPQITVLVVKDVSVKAFMEHEADQRQPKQAVDALGDADHAPRIVSFAKWTHPVGIEDEYEELAWIWPEGTDMKILEDWTKQTQETAKKVLGSEPAYKLSFVGTDPVYTRRGAASLLVQWGIAQCQQHGKPGYLESTLEAVRLYEKHGFEAAARIELDIESDEKLGEREQYAEIGFIYRP
ncbi:putative GNAT family acetyltransferase [Lojkania enalia]|uniref:GNAT family acetyltransferase n=1 Tax=Lojkania enalia TaxID=147567 RepID=A0A9P4KGV9_9PLEO|nr:putative GNAT family acetyltransferase [Didymosphaeria enalia]